MLFGANYICFVINLLFLRANSLFHHGFLITISMCVIVWVSERSGIDKGHQHRGPGSGSWSCEEAISYRQAHAESGPTTIRKESLRSVMMQKT